MSHFPSLTWFQGAAESIVADEDFRSHGRWLRARIAFCVDELSVVMHFDRGLVSEVHEGKTPHDFLIAGTADKWDLMFSQGWGLVRMYRTGSFDIQGEPVQLMREWKAIFFIAEALKRHHARVA